MVASNVLQVFMPESIEQSRPSFRDIWPAYRPFLKYIKADRPLMALDYFTICIAVITNSAMIWLIGKPFNLLQQGKYDEVANALLLFAAVVVINQAVQLAGGLLSNYIGFRTIGRMRNALLERTLALSFPIVNQMSRGDLLARLSIDVDNVKAVIFDALLFISSHVLTLCVYVSMLFWIDVQLALWALAISPLYLLHQRLFAPHKRKAVEKFLEYNGKLVGFEEQALANTKGISNFTAESIITKLHKKIFESSRFWITREFNIGLMFGISFTFMIYFTGLVIVLLGIEGIQQNRFGLGHLVSFLLYLGYLTVPSRGMAEIVFQSLGSIASAKRIQFIFSTQPRVTEIAQARELTVAQGEIEIQNLSFAYDNKSYLYQNVSLTINGGETIALVGPSGVGKSTLSILLARYYDPQHGSICIDHQNIDTVTLESLRNNITIVTQETFLLSDTIRANLLMVRPDATQRQLEEACKNSFAMEFIEKLEKGLDTAIGSGGVELSTGQKQRLSLAQAFLRNTPILVLDEATSALDSYSEQKVIQAIQRLRQSRTTLIIAHRYSSIKSADRVVYFNGDGTITIDKHEALIKSHSGYREAVEWQTQNKA
jgi:ABC-type multidrug transport system fused ATPase/permease subunit